MNTIFFPDDKLKKKQLKLIYIKILGIPISKHNQTKRALSKEFRSNRIPRHTERHSHLAVPRHNKRFREKAKPNHSSSHARARVAARHQRRS